MIEKSKQIFQKLMPEAESQPKNIFYVFKNEYYYRFEMYKEQYELGVLIVSSYSDTDEWFSDGWRGYYSQGVGAANYAKKLLEQSNNILALEYAQNAIVAWAQYFTYGNKYYNAYVHYALALGILG